MCLSLLNVHQSFYSNVMKLTVDQVKPSPPTMLCMLSPCLIPLTSYANPRKKVEGKNYLVPNLLLLASNHSSQFHRPVADFPH